MDTEDSAEEAHREDMRELLEQAESEELVGPLDAFDIKSSLTNREAPWRSAHCFRPDPDKEKRRPDEEPSLNSSIAGAGFEPATFGL